jgi:4-amino-4-deoxy-L-arabinose transferase-like glycosyltransferase
MLEARKWRFLFRIGMVCLGLFMGWRIYMSAIVPGSVPHWDEAAHALKGLLIAEDLKRGDWAGFLYDSYRQVYWPPLLSWFVGVALLVASPSIVTARLVSLGVFLLSAFFLYLAGLQMERERGELIAVVAVVLFLTNQAIVGHAAEVMLEIYGILFLILTFLLYFAITRRPEKTWLHFLLGLSVAGAYFAKSNYGILLFIVIVIAALLDVGFHVRRLLTRQMFYFLIPLIIIFALWFAYPPKIASTWQAMVNVPFGEQDPFTVTGFLFYPHALFEMAGSWWLFVVWATAFLISFRYWRDKNMRFLLLLILFQLALGQIHHTKVVRHHLPVLPAVFLLTGYVLAQTWAWGKVGIRYWLPRVASLALLAGTIITFSLMYQPITRKTDETLIAYLEEIAATHESIWLIGSMDLVQPAAPVLDWELAVQGKVLSVFHSGATMHYEQDRAAQSLLSTMPVPVLQQMVLPVLERSESSAPIRTLYLGLPSGTMYSSGAEGLEAFLRYQGGVDMLETAVVLSRKDDTGRFPESSIGAVLKKMGLEPGESRIFTQTKVTIYQTGATK